MAYIFMIKKIESRYGVEMKYIMRLQEKQWVALIIDKWMRIRGKGGTTEEGDKEKGGSRQAITNDEKDISCGFI